MIWGMYVQQEMIYDSSRDDPSMCGTSDFEMIYAKQRDDLGMILHTLYVGMRASVPVTTGILSSSLLVSWI